MNTIATLREKLNTKEADKKLAYIYGCGQKDAGRQKERLRRILDRYDELFGPVPGETELFSAPGRTEIGGNHTDHQGGRVLAAAINLDAVAAASPNGTGLIRLYSEGYGMIEADLTDLAPVSGERGSTAAILRGVAAGLKKKGYAPGGFDAYVSSEVPGGAGLSSSACFEILAGTIMNTFFCKGGVSDEELARIGQAAENEWFGKPSGLLDQMGCGIGGIIAVDFGREPAQVRKLEFDFTKTGFSLCIQETGGDHAALTPFYAAIPEEMGRIARCFGKERLCEIREAGFLERIPELREKAGDRAVLRAMHYFADCRRAGEEEKALSMNAFDRFLDLVRESGSSSFRFLQNVDTYQEPLRQPVALALSLAEAYLGKRGAARVHGGGFAGTIQAWVPSELLEGFRTEMERVFGSGSCHVMSIRPCGGCRLIE